MHCNAAGNNNEFGDSDGTIDALASALFGDKLVHEMESFVRIDAVDTPSRPHDAVYFWRAVEANSACTKRDNTFTDLTVAITDHREIGAVAVIVKEKHERVVFVCIENVLAFFFRNNLY